MKNTSAAGYQGLLQKLGRSSNTIHSPANRFPEKSYALSKMRR